MVTQQRLIVCLDGTWNQQDSSTNVLHHFNLVREGVIPGTNITQKKYYHTGVGTGVQDQVTGGGFGFGLEKNVRDAYNWLVENYCDGDGMDRPADEVYIFGFSRGAYTARSLVGFIGQRGLLRRAAPIPVRQMWRDYCILGRRKENRKSVWDQLFWQSRVNIRPITDLVTDPWLSGKYRTREPSLSELSEGERLLGRWSRRVQITYLGLYDTVGAIGWDALAIPGLTSRLAMHNNMRPTTIIQHCRHALAMDEHRSSFNHTPFLAFVGHDAGGREVERGADPAVQPSESASAEERWNRTRAMWDRKIEQRWFVGAHSNIGGGYEDNRLSEAPLQWILDGAAKAGLVSEAASPDPPVTAAEQHPRDSLAEFARPVWTKILRAKRNYRRIDPDPVPQASVEVSSDAVRPGGFSLQTVHEVVDDTAVEYWREASLPMPPNLYEYWCRRDLKINAILPAQSWLGERVSEFVALIVWATIAAAGLAALYKLIGLDPLPLQRLLGACLIAFVLPLIDWSESVVNFRCAMGLRGPCAQAFLDAIYWTRAFGVVLFACGAVGCAGYLARLGWRHAWPDTAMFASLYWPVPVFGAAAVILASGFRSKAAWLSVVLGPATTAGAAGLFIAVAWFGGAVFRTNALFDGAASGVSDSELFFPGLLLLLQLAFVYFWRAMLWTAEPMSKANLGSIVPLQGCFTPAQVSARLDGWRRRLECRWMKEDPSSGPAAQRMREVLRETLWRDIIGFIPVYSAVFAFGLWLAARPEVRGVLHLPGWPVAFWWLVPLIVAATDYAEDAYHLRYLKTNEEGHSPALLLTAFSWSMSGIKKIGVLIELAGTITAIVGGTLYILADTTDWRSKIAILISTTFFAAFAIFVIGRVLHFASGKRAGKLREPVRSLAKESAQARRAGT